MLQGGQRGCWRGASEKDEQGVHNQQASQLLLSLGRDLCAVASFNYLALAHLSAWLQYIVKHSISHLWHVSSSTVLYGQKSWFFIRCSVFAFFERCLICFWIWDWFLEDVRRRFRRFLVHFPQMFGRLLDDCKKICQICFQKLIFQIAFSITVICNILAN